MKNLCQISGLTIMIVLLGMMGIPNSFADPFSLFPTFVDSFSVATQETSPHGLAFSSEGTKMFVVGSSGKDVNEYTLSTGFDVSTAAFVDSFSVAAQEDVPRDVEFNPDGTKMFVVGNIGDAVNEYTLSTGFDVSTAAFVDSFSVAAQEDVPRGVAFNPDGTKMFVAGTNGDAVYEYTLSTGFDVSTAAFVDSFSVATQEILPIDVAFNPDGTKMFVTGSDGDAVYEYTLSTGFDVSTAAFVDSFSLQATNEIFPSGLAFSSDGTKMFVTGSGGDAVYEYKLTLGGICVTPPENVWIITENCEISSNIIAFGSVLIQNNSLVTINSAGSLTIPSGENLIIENNSGLLILFGGNLIIFS